MVCMYVQTDRQIFRPATPLGWAHSGSAQLVHTLKKWHAMFHACYMHKLGTFHSWLLLQVVRLLHLLATCSPIAPTSAVDPQSHPLLVWDISISKTVLWNY